MLIRNTPPAQNASSLQGVTGQERGSEGRAAEASLLDEFSSILDEIASRVATVDRRRYEALLPVFSDGPRALPSQTPNQLTLRKNSSVQERTLERQGAGAKSSPEVASTPGIPASTVLSSHQSASSQQPSAPVPASQGARVVVDVQAAPQSVHVYATPSNGSPLATVQLPEQLLQPLSQVPQGESLTPLPMQSPSTEVSPLPAKQLRVDAPDLASVTPQEVETRWEAAPTAPVTEIDLLLKQLGQRLGLRAQDESTVVKPAASRGIDQAALQNLFLFGIDRVRDVITPSFGSQAMARLGGLGAENGMLRQLAPSAVGVDSSAARSNAQERAQEGRSTRALPAPMQQRVLERVESVLREVAQSKDGKTISLRLDPPSLGSLKVDVSARDGLMHARIVAEVPAVAVLLRERAFELHDALRKLGLNVDRISVSVGSEGGNSTSFQSQSNQSGAQDGQGGDGGLGRDLAEGGEATREPGKSSPDDHWVA